MNAGEKLDHFSRCCIVLKDGSLAIEQNNQMAKAYSDDLRRKLLEAHDRGEGSLQEWARRFGVSVPWAWKISSQRRRTGQMERVPQRHGSPSRVTTAVEERLRSLVREQPDRTLVELQQGCGKAPGCAAAPSTCGECSSG